MASQLTQLNYSINTNQNLFDVATMVYGLPEHAYKIARFNGISITSALYSGQIINLPNLDVNTKVLKVYKNTGVVAATNNDALITQTGIGFMQIGTTFIVS